MFNYYSLIYRQHSESTAERAPRIAPDKPNDLARMDSTPGNSPILKNALDDRRVDPRQPCTNNATRAAQNLRSTTSRPAGRANSA